MTEIIYVGHFIDVKNRSPTHLGSKLEPPTSVTDIGVTALFRYEGPVIAQKICDVHFYHVIIIYFLDMLHMSWIQIDDFQI